MSKTKLAIIGAGSHAQAHYNDPAFSESGEIELCAACDLDKERVAAVQERYGIPHVYTDHREMLDAEDLDGVIIVLRPMDLTPVALDCIAKKKHVLLEKPPGCDLREAQELLDATKAQGVKAMVSVNRRFYPIIRYLKDEVIQDQPIVACSASYNKHGMTGDTWDWPSYLTVADAIHTVDLICHFAGKAVSVRSFAASRNADFINSVSAVAELESGAFATINNHQCSGFRKQLFEVHTEQVSAYLDLSDEQKPICELYVDNQLQDMTDVFQRIGTGYSEQLHFARWIRGEGSCIAELSDVMRSVELAEAAARGHNGRLPFA